MNLNDLLNLFQGPTATPAAVLAAAAFIAGMIVSCLACRLLGRPCKKTACAAKKPARSDAPKFEKRHPAPADGSIEIYVGNLSYDMTDDQLRKEFEAYGKVNSARIIINRYNGKSKGYAFVHMPNRSEADAAVKALDGKEIMGRPLKCNQAKNVG